MPTFRNTLFHFHRQVGVEWLNLRIVAVSIREKVWLENILSELEGGWRSRGGSGYRAGTLPRHLPSYWPRPFSSQTSRMNTPTVLKFSHSTPTCIWRGNRQSVPKRRHIKFRRRGITQKKTYDIQNTAKVWNKKWVNVVCSENQIKGINANCVGRM
jgi:hypothetical protein